jgi:hypothetical protein
LRLFKYQNDLHTTKKVRLLAAVLSVLLLFSAGIYVSTVVDRQLRQFIDQTLVKARERTGIQVTIGGIETGFGRIKLSEVSLGTTNWLVADQMTVKVSLNPWRDFLRPSQIVFGRLRVKLPMDRQLWPEDLRGLIAFIKGYSEKKQVGQGSQSSSRLPEIIRVQAARVEFSDGLKQGFVASGVALTGRIPERRIAARVAQVSYGDSLGESDLEIDLNLMDARVIASQVRRRPQFKGPSDWDFSCRGFRETSSLSCAVDAKHLPESFIRIGQRHLGEAFSPGFKGTFSVTKVNSPGGDAVVKAELAGDLTNVSGEHPSIGVGVVGPASVRLSASGDYSPREKRLIAKDSKVSLLTNADVPEEAITVTLNTDINYTTNGKFTGDVVFDLPDIACKQALAAMPANFAPELSEFKLGGSAELHGRFHLEESGADLRIHDSRFNCVVTSVPEVFSSAYLSGPFMIERGSGADKISIPVDPARPYFFSYREIPPLVRAAFVSSEDSGFFQHKGVEVAAIVGAAEKNAEVGRAAVGGSTITMQTVKNLFLARDKTISRKAQELFLAWHLEHVISKERILEIYLNMVEFGPGLYGIGRASQRFFDKAPKDLTLKESIYLASLLPAPVPRYRYYCKGEVTPNYDKILRQLLDRMLGLGRITADQHEEAISETLRFSATDRDTTCRIND